MTTSTLFDQSYEPWNGTLQPHPFRVVHIAWVGTRNIVRRNMISILLLYGLAILISLPSAFLPLIMQMPLDPSTYVNMAMSGALTWTFLLIVPLVGSGLIAGDIKHNALSMYFSKSILRADYVAGKGLTAFVLLLLPFLLPVMTSVGVVAYWLGEKATVEYTARLCLAALLCAPIALGPVIAVIMAFSSCTRRTFLAGIGWVVVFLILQAVSALMTAAAHQPWGYMLSIASNIFRIVQEVLPGPPAGWKSPAGEAVSPLETMKYSAWWSAAILAGITALSLFVVVWRLRNTERRT